MAKFNNMISNKIDFRMKEQDKEIQKLRKRSEERLDEFNKKLEELELNTIWKIKEYEQLLYQRPTQNEVQENIRDAEKRSVYEANMYTDKAIRKYADSDSSIAIRIDNMKQEFDKRIEDLIKEMQENQASHMDYRGTNESEHRDMEMRLMG